MYIRKYFIRQSLKYYNLINQSSMPKYFSSTLLQTQHKIILALSIVVRLCHTSQLGCAVLSNCNVPSHLPILGQHLYGYSCSLYRMY